MATLGLQLLLSAGGTAKIPEEYLAKMFNTERNT